MNKRPKVEPRCQDIGTVRRRDKCHYQKNQAGWCISSEINRIDDSDPSRQVGHHSTLIAKGDENIRSGKLTDLIKLG